VGNARAGEDAANGDRRSEPRGSRGARPARSEARAARWIRLSQVTLRRGVKALLEGADLTLYAGERVGLIGANGSGKSSLFAMLRGELHADKGDAELPAHWRVAHVAQETPALDRPAVEYAIDGDTKLRALQAELEQTHDGTRMGELHAALADADVYTVQSRAEALLMGLGFSEKEITQPVSTFSGGWRMRLNLAQALMCPSDLLLLDEPTNHLDLDAIIWLEEWLVRYAGTLIVISHDRDFLDGVVKAIVHIDQKKLKRYGGDYSSFEVQRAQTIQLTQHLIDKQERERAHLQSFIDRFRAKATKARQAQSRMKMLAKMEDPGAAARRRAVLVRVPRAGARTGSAPDHGSRRGGLRREDGARQHHALDPLGRAHRAARREWRRQIDFHQDGRRHAAAAFRGGGVQQGTEDRLLRPASGRDAARRSITAVAFKNDFRKKYS
jgi:ATPase subunit of ABC transporter with duplicated ATPase domains